jgi:putative component of membrane protein insertase Oxa1/YidC/SpoIIIJ protein YidD
LIRWVGTAALAAVLFAAPGWAEDAPWDYGAAPPVSSESGPRTLAGDVFDGLVAAYRSNKETTTVHRCLFDVSCSHFAERALNRYGALVGTVVFIDRYFYREHVRSGDWYPRIKEDDGTYLLDDSFYVP